MSDLCNSYRRIKGKRTSVTRLSKFADIFQEIPRIPPKIEIDFTIDLAPITVPCSKFPFRMSTPEMKYLLLQLVELLTKGYIRRVSPWGAPIFFVN